MNFHLFRRSGPSPRIRGEYGVSDQNSAALGTIPANTGRIPILPIAASHRRDHPREYGENEERAQHLQAGDGPSPRIRGESWGKPCSRCSPWDHPREYGENLTPSMVPAMWPGPSPRIRGEYIPNLLRVRICGTIPANTGRIRGAEKHPRRRWDHPREYGENTSATRCAQGSAGPSPRIRGE